MSTAASAARKPRWGSDRSITWVAGTLAVVGVALFWQFAVAVELLDPRYFPSMTATVTRLVQLLGEGFFWVAVGNTLLGAVLGLAIAVALGVPLGMIIGSNRWIFRAFRLPIEFLRPMPSVALIPAAVLLLGTGLGSKLFLAAFAAFWPVIIHVIYGMHATDSVVVETARSFRVRPLDRMLRIKLPAAFPFIFTGVRIAASVALILAVTAELLLGSLGLGQEINVARAGGALDLMYALILMTGILGLAINGVMVAIERRALHWHASQREVRM